MEVFQLFVGYAQLHAPQWIGLNQIDELPPNGALREAALQPANHGGRNNTMEQAAHRAREANIDLGEAQLGIAVGAQFDEVNVIDAHDSAAADVDDLLVGEVLLCGEPGLIGLIKLERAFAHVEADLTDRNGSDLVVTGYERRKMAASQQKMGNTSGLVRALDEEIADTPNVIPL